MSSGSERDHPTGIIRQGNKIVGSIVMPDADEIFIKEFNHCYGQLRMSVSPCEQKKAAEKHNPHTFQLPTWFRHVWHSRYPNDDRGKLQ